MYMTAWAKFRTFIIPKTRVKPAETRNRSPAYASPWRKKTDTSFMYVCLL